MRNIMMNIAQGDAYGAGFEFTDAEFIAENNTLSRYFAHPSGGLKAGHYTDDTQRSLAIVEMILSDVEWTPLNLANKMVEVFKRDPRDGYARGYQKFLQSVNNGEEFLKGIKPKSMRNGAAMSSVPLGVLPDIDQLMAYAEIQAKLTHDTPIGIVSSQAIALTSHLYYYGKFEAVETAIPEATELIKEKTGFAFRYDWNTQVGCDAYETVCGVLTTINQSMHRDQVFRFGVDLGGDTDSVLSIANGIWPWDDDMPEFLNHVLEDGRYGLHYLQSLDVELEEKFPSVKV